MRSEVESVAGRACRVLRLDAAVLVLAATQPKNGTERGSLRWILFPGARLIPGVRRCGDKI